MLARRLALGVLGEHVERPPAAVHQDGLVHRLSDGNLHDRPRRARGARRCCRSAANRQEEEQVVGVTAQIDSSSGGNEGVGFAIPSNTIRTVAAQLIATGKASHAYLGISLDSTASNALVAGVKSGTPAAKAGLKTGDVITSLGSAQTTTPDQLASAIAEHKPGDSVTDTYTRDGQSHTVTLTLASRPS